MAKFVFYYSTMGGRKTAEAIMTAFQYEEKGLVPLCLYPAVANRDGEGKWKSRVGLERPAGALNEDDDILVMLSNMAMCYNMPDVIMVDEAQFLTEQQVEDLAKIVDTMEIPVLCYGLLTDFKTRLFTGSKRLIELGAKLRELIGITSTGKRAVINAMIEDDRIIKEGETIQIGGNEKYRAISRKAYMEDVID